MSTKPPETSQIEWLPVKAMEVEPGFNVRSDAETKANAKDIAASLEARGGKFDPAKPLLYVEKDGHKYTRSHASLMAAQMLGIKTAPFYRVERNEIDDLAGLYFDNAAHPLDQYQQGKLFIRLRDGVKADTAESADATEKEGVAWIREPMELKGIAAMFGKSLQHVLNCILLNEQPEEIQQMILADEVSPNAIQLAWKGVKKESVAIKILQAAYNEAAKGVEDGKPVRATEKHVKIVKDQFVEPKKLKVARTSEAETPVETPKGKSRTETAESADTHTGGDSRNGAGASSDEQGELLSKSETAPTPRNKKTLHEEISGVIAFVSNERGLELDDADIDALAAALTRANIPF